MHLRSQLQTLKKGALKISDYIVKIKAVIDALMAAGQVITEQDLVAYILEGLGLEFDPVVCNIASKKTSANSSTKQQILLEEVVSFKTLVVAGQEVEEGVEEEDTLISA
ncbi:hypothetical protein ACOSQ4_006364 [Xanthoceras sorbifolium]